MAVKKALVSAFAASHPVPKKLTIGSSVMKAALGGATAASVLAPIIPGATQAPAIAAVAPMQTAYPVDAGYDETIAGLQKNRDQTQAQLGNQRQQGLLNYGYNYNAGQLTFDPTNPYSQAAMAKRNYDQARAGNSNNFAAQGQLYSGALQNAQNQTNYNEGQANDALLKNLQAFLDNNTSATTQAGTDYEIAAGQARSDALARAAANPAYAPVDSPAYAPAPAAAAPASPGAAAQTAVKAAFKRVVGTDSRGNAGVWHIYPDGHKVFVRS